MYFTPNCKVFIAIQILKCKDKVIWDAIIFEKKSNFITLLCFSIMNALWCIVTFNRVQVKFTYNSYVIEDTEKCKLASLFY